MKALIIHNPVAGQWGFEEELRETMALLASNGWQVISVEETHGYGDATTYARRAVAEGCSAVFVAGGDGTIAQAVDGLVGTDTALAVLPSGTGNVFARQVNLPLPGGFQPHPLVESARLALEGQVRLVDVGRVRFTTGDAQAHHFLCWSGVGFDAALNREINQDPERKKRLGVAGFIVAGFLLLRDFAGTSAIVRVDGHRVSRRMLMLVASNIQLYGIFFTMAPNAALDDGRLDVLCFQGIHPARGLVHLMRLIFRKHLENPEVDFYRARRVEVRTYRPLPVHVDGDCIGNTPAVLEVVPRALKLMVPQCAPASLFVDGTGMSQPETAWGWMMRRAREAHSAIRQRSGFS